MPVCHHAGVTTYTQKNKLATNKYFFDTKSLIRSCRKISIPLKLHHFVCQTTDDEIIHVTAFDSKISSCENYLRRLTTRSTVCKTSKLTFDGKQFSPSSPFSTGINKMTRDHGMLYEQKNNETNRVELINVSQTAV